MVACARELLVRGVLHEDVYHVFFRRVNERRLGVDGLAAKSILITQKVRVQRDPPSPNSPPLYIYIISTPYPFRQIRVKSHK